MELRLFKTIANNIVSLLNNDIAFVKEDEWSKYYFNKYHGTLAKICVVSILNYFLFLYVFAQYGMGIGQWEKRFSFFCDGVAEVFQEKSLYFLIFLYGFIFMLIGYITSISSLDIMENNYTKLNKFKLSIRTLNRITKFLFIVCTLAIATFFNLMIITFPEKLVLLSVILTFTLYITCIIAGRFFRGVFRTGYRFFLLEISVSLFVLIISGVYRLDWYWIVVGIIGIICDSFYVLSLYSTGLDDMSAELDDLTENLDETNKKLIYDIYVYRDLPFLFLRLYGMVFDFIMIFMRAGDLDD